MSDSIRAREAWFAEEMRVVGALLGKGGRTVAAEVAERVAAEDFGNADLGDIYRVALELWREGKMPDVGIVMSRLPRVTPAMLAECLDQAGAGLYAAEHADRVREEACRRRIRQELIDSLHEIKQPGCDAAVVAAKAAGKIREIARQGLSHRFRPTEATELIGKTFEETRWAVEGLLPEGLSVLAGPPKLGKSWLVLLVALAVASGTKACGRFGCPQGEVLYLALEDTPRRMQSRLRKILRRTHGSAQGLFLEYACPLLGHGLEDHLRGWMQDHPQTRLIVVDTLAKVRPPRGRNEEPYAADYRLMASLKAIADECRTAIVTITHTRKQADSDPLAEVSGTMGLTGAADAILVLKRERARADAILHVTGRDVEEAELAMTWNAEAASWMVCGEAREFRRSKEREEVLEVFRREGKALKLADLYDVLLHKKRGAVRSLVHELVKCGDVSGLGRGLYALAYGHSATTTTTTPTTTTTTTEQQV